MTVQRESGVECERPQTANGKFAARGLTTAIDLTDWRAVMEPTEWRPVVGFEGIYRVSNTGIVQRIAPGKSTSPGRTLKGAIGDRGYLLYTLCRDGSRKTSKGHRIVALAFLGEPPVGKNMVCHYDGDPSNNHVSNLRWGNHQLNHADSERHGTAAKVKGSRQSHCKRGHEMTPENSYEWRSKRRCRKCRVAWKLASDRARSADRTDLMPKETSRER